LKNILSKFKETCKTLDLDEIVKSQGLTVWRTELPYSFYGFLSTYNGEKFIIVNKGLPFWRQQITIAHGVGQYILSPTELEYVIITEDSFSNPKTEDQKANEMALQLHRINEDLKLLIK
jgi:Zn-dependent peptidase ImmA (M78 family)